VDAAFETALMVEYCARIHYQAKTIGEPTIIPDEEVEHLQSKFEGYGQNQ
jgi:L-fuculose-phosphate aldolase